MLSIPRYEDLSAVAVARPAQLECIVFPQQFVSLDHPNILVCCSEGVITCPILGLSVHQILITDIVEPACDNLPP